MRLKTRPEDFRVEEVTRLPPAARAGEYALFRLEKRSVSAFDAIDAIAGALGVAREDVAVAGLKDLRSRSSQVVSVRLGAREVKGRVSAGAGLALEPIGRAARAVRSEDIEANRFSIVVRDLTGAAVAALPARIEAVRRAGVANYFDDQRFGGASPARGFVAEAWSKGELERALELLIARPSPKDPRRERLEKKVIAERFGRWKELEEEIRGEAAPVVRRLAQAPDDLAGAFRALDERFRSLLVSQYQSYLWNEAAAAYVRATLPRADTFDVMYRCGTLVFWRGAAAPPAHDVPFAPIAIPPGIGVAARGGSRPLALVPDALEAGVGEADDLFLGRRKVLLRMELPRGAYATIVVKRLLYEPERRE